MANKPIAITAPDFRVIQLDLEGTAPLVINKFSAKAQEKMKLTQEAGSTSRSRSAKEAKDFQELGPHRKICFR